MCILYILYKITIVTFIYQPAAVVYISNYMLLSINITRTVLMCIPSILYIIFILDIGYIIWQYDYILSNIHLMALLYKQYHSELIKIILDYETDEDIFIKI
jgi:hypothetical protein